MTQSAEQTLAQARAAVERDAAGVVRPQEVDDAVIHRRWWLDQWPAGAPHLLGLLAQDVQEAVHERDPGWPACTEPSCPAVGGHPLLVEPDLDPDPFWACHRTGLPVAPVGGLPRDAAGRGVG